MKEKRDGSCTKLWTKVEADKICVYLTLKTELMH